jgi:hypothetical protein
MQSRAIQEMIQASAQFCAIAPSRCDGGTGLRRPPGFLRLANRQKYLTHEGCGVGPAGEDYFFFRHLPQDLRPLGAIGTCEVEFGVSETKKAKAKRACWPPAAQTAIRARAASAR